jgi:hypothetical protein
MDTTSSSTSVSADVLHAASHSTLSAEEIAKAVAHHNRHHHGQEETANPSAGKKSKNGKSK